MGLWKIWIGVPPPPPPLDAKGFGLSEKLVMYEGYPYSMPGKLTQKVLGRG